MTTDEFHLMMSEQNRAQSLYAAHNKKLARVCGCYLVRIDDYIKVGYSINIKTRYSKLRSDFRRKEVYMLGYIEAPESTSQEARRLEMKLHGLLSDFWYQKEFFQMEDDELVEFLLAEGFDVRTDCDRFEPYSC